VSDFDWIVPNEFIITAIDQNLTIQHISTAERPYASICTSAHDFSIYDEVAYYNDTLRSRDPDEFLKDLEKKSTESLFNKLEANSKRAAELGKMQLEVH